MKRITYIALLILLIPLFSSSKRVITQKQPTSPLNNPNSSKNNRFGWTSNDLQFYGLLAGAVISMIGFVAAFLLILFKRFSSEYYFHILIQILFAFSCGALIGEVMLHILPEAYRSKHTTQTNVSLVFISAILSFIGLERFMEHIHISHSHWHQISQDEKEHHAIQEKKQLEKSKEPKKESTGYLNLVSSLLHNMIDGLAVGVAFSLGNPNEFIPVVIGIVAHEIPREMGDVSILMKSNFSDREIILSNGFVNCISIVGVILGLNSMVIPPTIKQYILVFVGGNFMYIAADIWKNLFRQKSGILNILEILGFAVGVYVSLGDTCGHSHSH